MKCDAKETVRLIRDSIEMKWKGNGKIAMYALHFGVFMCQEQVVLFGLLSYFSVLYCISFMITHYVNSLHSQGRKRLWNHWTIRRLCC